MKVKIITEHGETDFELSKGSAFYLLYLACDIETKEKGGTKVSFDAAVTDDEVDFIHPQINETEMPDNETEDPENSFSI